MADAISIQELIDARTDAKTLEEAVNGDAVTTVLSRLGETYPTLSNALNQIDGQISDANDMLVESVTTLFTNGGLPAKPFKTKALMTASALVDGEYAQVTDDTVNNGLYVKTAGAWVKSGYDPLAQAKADATTKADAAVVIASTNADNKIAAALTKSSGTFDTLAQLTASPLINGAFAMVANDTPAKNGHYKKVSGTWTKTGYDPIEQAKAYTDNLKTVLDISALTQNNSMTLEEAIASVPVAFRREGTAIEFNDGEQYEFKGTYTEAKFSSIRYWLRPSHKDSLNLFDESMVYRGFSFDPSKTGNEMLFAPDRAIAIIPITRMYDGDTLLPLKISFDGWEETEGEVAGIMDGNLDMLWRITRNALGSFNIPVKGRYAYISYAKGTIDNSKNSSFVRYTLPKYDHLSNLELADGKPIDVNSNKKGLIKKFGLSGEVFYSTENSILVNPLARNYVGVNHSYLSEIILGMHLSFSNNGDRFIGNGSLRKIYIARITKGGTTVTVRMGVENLDAPNTYQIVNAATVLSYNGVDVPSSTEVSLVASVGDLQIFIDVNPQAIKQLSTGSDITPDEGMVSQEYLLKRYNEKPTSNYDRFDMFEVAKTSFISNNDHRPPASKLAETLVLNGDKIYTLTGSSSAARHEQCALIASKRININGTKAITVFCSTESDAEYSQPEMNLIRSPSAMRSSNSTLGMYVHPDVVCIPDGFLGYKYWMSTSVYPYSYAPIEDTEILVSNDGLSWERVLHPYETSQTNIPFRIPLTYWDVYDPKNPTERDRFFMPIPRKGATMEFHTSSGVSQNTVKGMLNHDPAISFQNGWLNIYVVYNFGLNSSTLENRYTVCYRTQDFVNWEVVREDGTGFAYNQASAQTIFSSTNGVRNHIYYDNYTNRTDVSQQFVRVSDTEWYCYAVRTSDLGTNLVRFSGTSPYNFDWSSSVDCTLTPKNIQKMWHIAVKHIDGKFYFMYGGYLASSDDGINFINNPVPIIYAGMQGAVYKPYLVKGHDGKLKVGASVATIASVVEPHLNNSGEKNFTRNRNVPLTASLEYPSIAYALELSRVTRKNAFVDLVVSVNRERTGQYFMHHIAGAKGQTTLKGIDLREGDYVRVTAFLNTFGDGVANFEGVLIDDRV